MPIVREHGAAVIALTIDETGQARTAETKVAVADRLIRDLTETWGMRTSDIVVDCLTFTIATGQEESRRDAIETIEAIRQLKALHPDVQTTLGLSNISLSASRRGSTPRSSTRPASCPRPASPTSSARSPSTSSTTGAAQRPRPSRPTTR